MSKKAKKAHQATDKPSRQEQAQIILEQKLAAAQALIGMLERPFSGKVYVIELEEPVTGQFLRIINSEGRDTQINFAGDLQTTPRYRSSEADQVLQQFSRTGYKMRKVHLIDAARAEVGRLNAILDYHLAMTAPEN